MRASRRIAVCLFLAASSAACGGGGGGGGGGGAGGQSTGPGAWRRVDAQLVNGVDIVEVGSRLLAASVDGVFVSDDDGATWGPATGTPVVWQ